MRVTVGVIRSVSLYIFLPSCAYIASHGFEQSWTRADDPKDLPDRFLLWGLWSFGVLIAVTIAGAALTLGLKRLQPRRYCMLSVSSSVIGGLGYAFVNPWDGLRAPFINRRYNDLSGLPQLGSKLYSMFHFAWSASVLIYATVGVSVTLWKS